MRTLTLAAAIPILVSAVPLLVSACALASVDREIEVVLPHAPAHWQVAFPQLGFLVSARDASGRETVVIAQGGRGTVSLRCARAVNAPVLAWPFAPGIDPGLLRPAGAFFGLCARRWQGRDVIELSWENGAAALVAERAAAAGRDLSRFNVERLCVYFSREADPWALDLDHVAQELVTGNLSAWDIDALPRRDVTAGPGAGTWFLESPFCSPVVSEGGILRLPGVPLGIHHLFSLRGQRCTLDVRGETPVLVP